MLLCCFCLCVLFLKVSTADRKSLPYPGGIPSPSAKIRLQGKRVKAASPAHHALEEGFSSLPIETKHRGVFGLKGIKENKQVRCSPKEEGGDSRSTPLPGWEGSEPGMRCGQVGMQLSSQKWAGCNGMLNAAVRGACKAHQQPIHHRGYGIRHLLYWCPNHQLQPMLQTRTRGCVQQTFLCSPCLGGKP